MLVHQSNNSSSGEKTQRKNRKMSSKINYLEKQLADDGIPYNK